MGRKKKYIGRKTKKPLDRHVVKQRKDAIKAVEALELIQWLIDENHPQRRAAYLAGYLEEPQEYLATVESDESEVKAGEVGGLFLSAGLTLLTGDWVLAGIGLVAGLIQYALRPGEQKKATDPRYAPSYGGDFSARVASFGTTIPAIFCSKSLDPTGGVQTAGELIHTRIETVNGNQIAYSRYIISHGNVTEIDLNRTVINEQPRSHFYQNNINLNWCNGSQTTVPADFQVFSQNFPISSNNGVGVGLLAKDVVASAIVNTGGGGGGGGLIVANYWYDPDSTPEPIFIVGQSFTMYVTADGTNNPVPYPFIVSYWNQQSSTITCYQDIINTWTPIIYLYGTVLYTNATVTLPAQSGVQPIAYIQPTPHY